MSRGHREPRYALDKRSPDASFRGRKRRFEEGPRNAEGPKRQRMEEEAGENTDQALAPIGYKVLERICREAVAENAVLELTKNARQFEELLSMEEIRPDLLKLVISSFRLLCTSNNIMTANAEKILRSPTAKNFITGRVLSKFINEMEYSSDISGIDTVINDLTVIFLALIQKFGESIVYILPLPQLNASLVALKEKNLIEDADDLEKKLQHVKELKEDVIRRAKSAHEQESQLEPPQSFREISVIPEAADLLCSRPFLRENITDRKFKDLDHYLDVQFRLLREDFVIPLRDGIKQLTKESNSLEPYATKNARRTNDVAVYHDVTVLSPVCSNKGRVYKIKFDQFHSQVRRVKWERSKRLKFGSLVCLSSDEFSTFVFATVENRKVDELRVGELDVRFENVGIAEIERFIRGRERFVMLESSAYFEAYRHVLEALKEIKAEEFPFHRHIVECCQDVGPPDYQLQVNEAKEDKDAFLFNFAGILAKTKSVRVPVNDYHPSPVSSQATIAHVKDSCPQEDHSAGACTDFSLNDPDVAIDNEVPHEIFKECTDSLNNSDVAMDNEMPHEIVHACNESLNNPDVAMDNDEVSHEIFDWPDRESLGFNKSQMRAFKLALTKKFAVIQGPPGTGKTYVGLKIAKALLENASLWQNEEEGSPILMVSYTNHALDQFLEGLLPMRGIVRVGSRSKSRQLEQCNLKSLKAASEHTVGDARRTNRDDIRAQKQSYERSSRLLEVPSSSIISLDVLKSQKCIRSRHYAQFSALAGRRSINEELLKWLNIKRNKRFQNNRPEDYQRDDIFMQLETQGFCFDNYDEFHRDDDVTFREIAVLSINDTDNPNYMRRNLNRKAMSENEEGSVACITDLKIQERWKLYRLWCQRLQKHQQEYLQSRQEEFEEALLRDKELDTVVEYNVLQKARVIGMTTTCAARYRRILQRISPKIVLVEEAAEVLEAHIITSLTKGCQHLILIGDHQQLRPNPAVYELAKKYKLDVSLFERMVNVGVQCERLNVQHRMRPEIAALMKHIYKDLKNHKSVEKYDDIKGMKKNLFFVNHSHLENHNDESHSHINEHEAKFLVALCHYLLQQGYRAEQITLLTPYAGQMFAIRDYLEGENGRQEFKGVRYTTVDNFQGEENDIILLSLVRSNKNEKVGFINIVNRACVALSRAKKGFYCIGNFDLLSTHSVIWTKIVADLKASGSIGNALPLVCQIHHEEVTVEAAEDFSKNVPDGGCLRHCEERLRCGHGSCKRLCHPHGTVHDMPFCEKPCARNIKGCTHKCPRRCGEPCDRHCRVLVKKVLPVCGHIARVECSTDVKRVLCIERCEKILSCGHGCQGYCTRPCTTECPVPCGATLDCGHQQCSGTCGECRMGRVHKRCQSECDRVLVCSHLCKEVCTIPCPPCSRNCENRCVHGKCEKKCDEPCAPCREPCSWECSHHKCYKQCHEICDRPRCNVPCRKILPCYHVCRGLMCQKQCICAVCDTNDGGDPITNISFGGEDEEDARFIKLSDCGHIFAVSDLDRYMDMTEDDSTESHAIQMKMCPRCTTPIRLSLRYGDVIKRRLQEIEKVKEEIRVKTSRGLPNKTSLLLDRLNNLSKKFSSRNHRRSWLTLRRAAQNVKNGLMADLLENKVMLMERYCLLTTKMEAYSRKLPAESRKANVLDGKQVANDLHYLLKRFMADKVTQRELQDINTEFSRLNLQLELCSLSHDVNMLALELDEPCCEMMTAVRDELSSGKRIEDEKLDEMMKNIATIRRAYPSLNPLTPEEKKQIVEAVGVKKGSWFKCRQGHIYAIGECGGAMETGTCPVCKSVIGGTNHKLEEGNELAPEMDGARHAAWSEQANLQNYEL